MIKVITYGTYDLFHDGHQKLLERAKELGDYLIVSVTADDFDKARGKINVQQPLIERIENVRATGLANEIIVEEYEGQKIDDIKRYSIDIFTVGSDWEGKFEYLKEYCSVVYLPRTEGISSTELRSDKRALRFGIVGEEVYINKFIIESKYVNGLEVTSISAKYYTNLKDEFKALKCTKPYNEFLDEIDAVFIASQPKYHYEQIKEALNRGKHVLCESPITTKADECKELFQFAEQKSLVLMESIKTAYSTAYYRLILLAKTGKIGKIVSVDATCTNLMQQVQLETIKDQWKSIEAWGPTALLPVFQLFGTKYKSKQIITKYLDKNKKFDAFTKIDFLFDNATATVKIGKGIKSEGELVISGTGGYFYVPAPWWKTDYFEIRYENLADNKRIFYQLDGEGIRYELVSFIKAIQTGKNTSYISKNISLSLSSIIEDFENGTDVEEILF